MKSIYSLIEDQIQSFNSDTITLAEGYEFNQKETIKLIELYTYSQFESGKFDSLDREKPFFNIVNFRVNVSTRATDIDTKDIQYVARQAKDQVKAMAMTQVNRK